MLSFQFLLPCSLLHSTIEDRDLELDLDFDRQPDTTVTGLFLYLSLLGSLCSQFTTEEADAIPLHVLGVVDVEANNVPDNVLLASALRNVTRADRASGWAVK